MKVFISHSSDDKRFVRTLKTDLNENGIHTWFDEDELNFGDSLVEKLEFSVEDTSHFIIVLSESSINSIWVKKELKQVLKSIDKRIIPIKYKDCNIPEELSKLLFGDVSKITRVVAGDKLIFKDDNYYYFLERLIKSLNTKKTALTDSDKKLLTSIDSKINQGGIQNSNLKLKIINFSSSYAREVYSNKVLSNLSSYEMNDLKSIVSKPIILPRAFKEIFKDRDIKLGTRICFKNKSGEQREGVFGGYRKQEDNVIVIPVSITNFLNIEMSNQEFDFVISDTLVEMLIL
jgi:hypothetical protein